MKQKKNSDKKLLLEKFLTTSQENIKKCDKDFLEFFIQKNGKTVRFNEGRARKILDKLEKISKIIAEKRKESKNFFPEISGQLFMAGCDCKVLISKLEEKICNS